MKNLSFEQRIALQLGELIMEVKRLETVRDQMAEQISKLAHEKSGSEVQTPRETPNSSSS